MVKDKDKFNFFVPAEFIVKANKNGKKEMYIKGVASSEVEDSDGETLVPSGYDLSPLLTSGFLNYNHQAAKDPNAIIGQPTKAEIINGGKDLYIEGFLYPDSEAAQSTYKLAQVLEKNSPDRRMGFSIEGKAIEKDPLNPKRITKARITGVAITPCPKNPNTLLSIMKGEYAEPFIEVEELEKGGPGSGRHKIGDVAHHVAMKYGHGKITQIKNGQVRIDHGNGHEYDYSEDEVVKVPKAIDKAMTAAVAEGVTQKESVEGGKKVFDKLLEEKGLPKNAHLKKSEAYALIINRYSDYFKNDIEKAKQIFSLVKEFNSKLYGMENTNGEVLSKALESTFQFIDEKIEEIKKSEENTSLEEGNNEEVVKSESNDADDKDESSVEKAEGLEKGYKEEFKTTDAPVGSGTYGGVDVYLKHVIRESFSKGETAENIVKSLVEKGCENEFAANLVKSVEDEMSKLHANGGIEGDGIDTDKESIPESTHSSKSPQNPFNKSEEFELIKGEVSSLQGNQDRLVDAIEKRFNSLGTILKSQNSRILELTETTKELKSENTNLKKSLVESNQKLEQFASTPQRAKTITNSRQIERFEGESIQKSESGKDVYSLKNGAQVNDLKTILESEFDSRVQKGEHNMALGGVILDLDLAKTTDRASLLKIQNVLNDLNIAVIE